MHSHVQRCLLWKHIHSRGQLGSLFPLRAGSRGTFWRRVQQRSSSTMRINHTTGGRYRTFKHLVGGFHSVGLKELLENAISLSKDYAYFMRWWLGPSLGLYSWGWWQEEEWDSRARTKMDDLEWVECPCKETLLNSPGDLLGYSEDITTFGLASLAC